MANCVYDLLRSIWSFVVGSLRMILFFGCLLSVLIQTIVIALLLVGSRSATNINLPGEVSVSSKDYLYAFLVLALAVLGCYGSFYKHHKSIKYFALLSAFNAAFLIVWIWLSTSPDKMEAENEKIAQHFRISQKFYDWSTDSIVKENEANKQWDFLQKLLCCGLKGPNDWNDVRPKSVNNDTYPASCCLLGIHSLMNPAKELQLCKTHDALFRTGCLERVQQAEVISVILYFMFFAFHLILFSIAYCVSFFSTDRPASNSQPSTGRATLESGRTYSPHQDYQRFDRSVYIRQPPTNESHHESGKISLPPMYPNVNDVEKACSPPPSYGTQR